MNVINTVILCNPDYSTIARILQLCMLFTGWEVRIEKYFVVVSKPARISCLVKAIEAEFTHGKLTVNEEDGSVHVQIPIRLIGQHEREFTIR